MLASILSDLPKSTESTEFHSVCLGILTYIEEKPSLLLIHRGHNVPSHKNQIAFVGGHHKKGESAWETAKREYEEELALSPDTMKLLGFAPSVFTRFGRIMQPVYVEVPYEEIKKSISNGEWDFAAFYPLSSLLDESVWQCFNVYRGEQPYPVYLSSLNFKCLPVLTTDDGQKLESFILWGATAKVVWNLKNYLKDKGYNGNL